MVYVPSKKESIGNCALCLEELFEEAYGSKPTCFGVRICNNCEKAFKRNRINAKRTRLGGKSGRGR